MLFRHVCITGVHMKQVVPCSSSCVALFLYFYSPGVLLEYLLILPVNFVI